VQVRTPSQSHQNRYESADPSKASVANLGHLTVWFTVALLLLSQGDHHKMVQGNGEGVQRRKDNAGGHDQVPGWRAGAEDFSPMHHIRQCSVESGEHGSYAALTKWKNIFFGLTVNGKEIGTWSFDIRFRDSLFQIEIIRLTSYLNVTVPVFDPGRPCRKVGSWKSPEVCFRNGAGTLGECGARWRCVGANAAAAELLLLSASRWRFARVVVGCSPTS